MIVLFYDLTCSLLIRNITGFACCEGCIWLLGETPLPKISMRSVNVSGHFAFFSGCKSLHLESMQTPI